MYWKSIDGAIKFWLMKGGVQQIQKGPLITSVKNPDTDDEEQKSLDIDIMEAQDLINLLAKKRRKPHMGKSQDDGDIGKGPKFDRYHWYRNAKDMDRAQGELRKRLPTPKKFKRRLDFN